MTTDEPLRTATLSHLLGDNERLWDAITDLREGLAELDHAKAPKRQVEQLHSRIDEMEGKQNVER